MFVPFETLAPSSRVWIFQAAKEFSPSDLAIINDHLKLLTQSWAAHGQPMKASYRISENQFIILGADEDVQAASGCSIDQATRGIKDLSSKINNDLFSRETVLFKMGDGKRSFGLKNLKDAFQSGLLDEKTVTFNNLVSTKGQLESQWLVAAGETWLRRYLKAEKMQG